MSRGLFFGAGAATATIFIAIVTIICGSAEPSSVNAQEKPEVNAGLKILSVEQNSIAKLTIYENGTTYNSVYRVCDGTTAVYMTIGRDPVSAVPNSNECKK